MTGETHHPDRKTGPAVHPVDSMNWQPPEQVRMPNGMDIYIFRDPSFEVTHLTLSFYGGGYTERKPLAGQTMVRTLQEGTTKHSSEEIARQFDFLGSYLNTTFGKDSVNLNLFFLNRYAKQNLSLLSEMLLSPLFPEKEVNLFLRNLHEEWKIKQEQVAYLANSTLPEALFGKDHPYGRKVKENDFRELSCTDVRDYYHLTLHPSNGFIVLAGNITDEILNLVESSFMALPLRNPDTIQPVPNDQGIKKTKHIDRPDALQTAIAIGKQIINRNHPDYPGLQLLNTMLGGYFGSRLMQNLREEKGLTYGIHSSLISLRYNGIFSMSAEVASAQTSTALEEIFKEIKRLREEKVFPEELQLVKQYYAGNLLEAFDGVVRKAEMVRSLNLTHTPFDYFSRLTKEIIAVTPERILELANTYLDPESMTVVTAGKNNGET